MKEKLVSHENIQHLKNYLLLDGYTQEEVDKVSTAPTTRPEVIYFSVGISAKRFINKVMILELKEVVNKSPWLAFSLIGNGIEVLGKCIDPLHPTSWDQSGRSRTNFEDAIKNLNGLNKYIHLLNRKGFDLYAQFRCGLTHGLAPKGGISLSSGNQSDNLSEQFGSVNFHIESLYEDFKTACLDVIGRTYAEPNKMNAAKIFVNGTFTVPTEGAMRT